MAESAAPSTPRRRSHRRLAVVLSVVLGLLLVRLWWGYEADRRMRRLVDDLRERGLPTEPEDFVARDVPPDQDGAARLQAILAKVDRSVESPLASNQIFPGQPPFPPEWHEMTRAAMAAQADLLREIRSARAFARFAWRPPPADPMKFIEARHLANLLADAAAFAHVNGNDAAAIEYLLDVLWIADGAYEFPTVVSRLVANGLDAMVGWRLSMMAPELRVTGPLPSGRAGGATPVDRAVIHALIARLLETDNDVARLERALYAERFYCVSFMTPYAESGWLVRPMYEMEAVRLAGDFGAIAERVNLPDLPAVARSIGPPAPRSKSGIRKITHVLSHANAPDLNLVRNHFLIVTFRQMTAVSLAVRLYRLDHGRYPASLDDLVPAYLPEVPVDRMAGDGRPLGYTTLADGTRPVVYNVGLDGVSDTAQGAQPSDKPHYDVHSSEPDDWRDLSRWSPPAKPETESSGEAGDDER